MPHKSRKIKKTNWLPFYWFAGIFPGLVVLWESVNENENLRFFEDYWNGSDSEALATNDKAKMLDVIKIDSYQEGRPYLETNGHKNDLHSIENKIIKRFGLPEDFELGKIPENLFFEVSIVEFNIFLMNMSAILHLGGMSVLPEEALQCDSLADVNKVLLERVEKLETMNRLMEYFPKDLVNIVPDYV